MSGECDDCGEHTLDCNCSDDQKLYALNGEWVCQHKMIVPVYMWYEESRLWPLSPPDMSKLQEAFNEYYKRKNATKQESACS